MAKGYFRTDNTICVYCGHREMGDDGKMKPMPHKTGSKNNPIHLCEKCHKKATEAKR